MKPCYPDTDGNTATKIDNSLNGKWMLGMSLLRGEYLPFGQAKYL